MFKLRTRVKHTLTFEERLAAEAKRLREAAERELPGSILHEQFLRRARQAEAASHMSEWLRSPGLQSPKWATENQKHLWSFMRQMPFDGRKLPIGAARNDLRQLAGRLLRLHRAGFRADVEIIEKATKHWGLFGERGKNMKDYLASIEKLRSDAAEAALIRDLATDPTKRDMFDRLHAHLNRLADEVEHAMNQFGSSGTKVSGTMSDFDA